MTSQSIRLVEDIVMPPTSQKSLKAIAGIVALSDRGATLVGPDGTSVELPVELYQVLRVVADELVRGNAVTVAPHRMKLTTQEAAEFIGVSRPTLVKLLDSGKIPHTKINRHRRVQLDDLRAYQVEQRKRRRAALDSLTTTSYQIGAYELPMHYDVDCESTVRS